MQANFVCQVFCFVDGFSHRLTNQATDLTPKYWRMKFKMEPSEISNFVPLFNWNIDAFTVISYSWLSLTDNTLFITVPVFL
jgi:hypothetical protein